MADNITIQSIHPEAKSLVVVLNIEGQTYPKVVPILDLQDPSVLTAQLQALARELRAEFDALTAAIHAADAAAQPAVSDAVSALVGTSIPVDTSSPAPQAFPAQPADQSASAGAASADQSGAASAAAPAPPPPPPTPAA